MASATPESDQQRQFATLQRQIAVATREQGADPDENFRLRFAIRRAREVNMPEDAIDRARKQGEGELAGPDLIERTFEGYGSNGIAVLVESITDDPKRTSSELADLFESHGGNLGEDGCVAWQFERRGVVHVDARDVGDPDQFMLEVIELGGDELREPLLETGDRVPAYQIYCDPNDLRRVVRALEEASYPVRTASIVYEPEQRVELAPDATRSFLAFFEKLLAHPDVQNAYANWTSA
jgi:YebC/PmpR family DNA-binding regulatory protein